MKTDNLSPVKTSGPSDCIIIAKENPDETGLEVLQVIEGISYYPKESKINLIFDLFVQNNGDQPVRYRIIHRGGVTGKLCQYSFEGDERYNLLHQLYESSFNKDESNLENILFYQRKNCLGKSDKATSLSLLGPGGCFEKTKEIKLERELPSNDESPAFTSFLIPPKDYSPIQPGEASVCRIHAEVLSESYKLFIQNPEWFSVDSYRRLLDTIEIYDLPCEENHDLHDFFHNNIKNDKSIIPPLAYDIVVFQDIGDPVIAKSGSISIIEAQPKNQDLAKRVLRFFGQPKDFYLILGYRNI